MHADPGVDPLNQFSGLFINVEQAWDENGGFTDRTTAFNTSNPGGPNNVLPYHAISELIEHGRRKEAGSSRNQV